MDKKRIGENEKVIKKRMEWDKKML